MHGNFEVVVQERGNLIHYWHDNATKRWSSGGTISNAASGPGCITQSDIKSRDGSGVEQRNFEVVALEGNNLVHYWHDNTKRWSHFRNISTTASRAGCIIQSDWG
jgi:hypothetical protein